MTSIDIRHGDCLTVLRGLPDNSVDSVVTDPPYGLSNTKPAQVADVLAAWVTGDTEAVPAKKGGFMGKDWDSFVPPPAVWAECLRVLKPGGHMAVFAGARTQDLMGLSIRLAGFEIRDTLGWIYGCLSEDTEVLINGEWAQYHKAKAGDLALCYNKEHDTYEWQPIEDTHKYEYSDTAYRIRSDNTDQIVSRNHRVLVERGGAYEFEYAENLAREHQIRVPILESLPALLGDLSVRESLPGGEEPILRRELRNVRPSTGCGEADGATRNDGDCVCRVRDEGVQAECLVEESGNSNVLTRVQREVARGGMEGARTQGPGGMVGGNENAVRGESARGEQPSLEGRGDVETRSRELQGCPVCEVPAGVPEYGAEGWVRDGAPASGGPGYRATPVADGSCTSCESQAGGQSAGEPVSVRVKPGSQAVRGARHTVADLADIEPVHYEGVVWCLTVPTGAFVVRRNGKVFVTGNSGFPKSMDVSKAIDRSNGENRNRQYEFTEWMRSTGITSRDIDEATGTNMGGHYLTTASQPAIATADLFDKLRPLLPEVPERIERLVAERTGIEWTDYVKREVTQHATRDLVQGDAISFDQRSSAERERRDIPATSAAARWSGWGTALKPAIEPIILARKPLDGTVAGNVLAHGVGGLNIDACRVGSDGGTAAINFWETRGEMYGGGKGKPTNEIGKIGKGRFPANVLLDEHAAKEMDEQSGVQKDGTAVNRNKDTEAYKPHSVYGEYRNDERPDITYGGGGGASRFFPVFKYQAKAPKKERPVIYKNNCECEEWQSQQKATTESTETEKQSWNTSTSGSSTPAQYQTDMISTISTTTSSTTESKTSPASAKSSISESTQDARSETENGGSHANSAEVSNQSLKITGTSVKKDGHNTDGVGHATSAKWYTTSECEKCGEPRRKVQHVTVKPLGLMEWLVTLITPEGGTTLDPFAGTGTTLQAARDKGFNAIGVEQDEDYIALIEQRLSA